MPFSRLTGEMLQRVEKLVHQLGEAAKVVVRNERHRAMEYIKKSLKTKPDAMRRREKEVGWREGGTCLQTCFPHPSL